MIAVKIIKLWLKLRALRRRQSREGNAVMSKIPQEAIDDSWVSDAVFTAFNDAYSDQIELNPRETHQALYYGLSAAFAAARAQGADITDEIVEKALSAYYSESVWLQNMNGGANDSFRTSMREALKAVRSDMVALAVGAA